MQGVFVILLVFLSIAVAPGHACSEPRDWMPQSFQERLLQASFVLGGKVTSTTEPINGYYEATFEVECYYKGLDDNGPKIQTVGGFGWACCACVDSNVEIGENYIVFFDPRNMVVAHINLESGVTESTPEIIAEVEQNYSCMIPQ